MGKLRFLFALWMAKLSIPALKITHHNGTDFPGSLAVRLCPDFLRYVGKPKTIVAVTGTNGKTTVSNMLNDILEAGGRPPRADHPRRQQHRLRRVHRLHPELRPAGPREKV